MKGHAIVITILLSFTAPGAPAAGVDDADERLFKAQQVMAAKGDPNALYYLGEMYEHGLGTKIDVKQAFEQYESAAAKGSQLAKRKLANRKQIEAEAAQGSTGQRLLREQEARQAKETPKVEAVAKAKAAPKAEEKAKADDKPKEEAEAAKPQPPKAAGLDAAARERLRAKLRERLKNPIPEPFE